MAAAIAPFESALEEIVRERHEVDAAEAAWLEKVAAYSVSGGWAADNYLSAAAAIGDHCHMTRTAAAAAVRLAVKLLQLPELGAAFSAGDTSRAHVEVVARAYTRARAGEFDQHQDALALLAVNATPADLYQAVTKITDTIDGDGGAANDDDIYEKRQLHSSKTMDGVRGSWFLDGEAGTIVNAALDAQMETARIEDDPRTPAQRRADALVDICRFSLTFGDHPPTPPNDAAEYRTGCWSSTSACSNKTTPPSSPTSAPNTPPAQRSHWQPSSGSCATATSAA